MVHPFLMWTLPGVLKRFLWDDSISTMSGKQANISSVSEIIIPNTWSCADLLPTLENVFKEVLGLHRHSPPQ